MAGKIIELERERDFDEFISKGIVVVDFRASWCGPCSRLAYEIEKANEACEEDVLFLKVNVDKFGKLADRFGVRGIPYLVFFKDGEKVKKSVGLISEKKILKLVGEARNGA